MKNTEIRSITTYEGFAGSRYADIVPPSDARAGALQSLVDFLNEQPELRAVPAFDADKRQHILRVSGFQEDAQLVPLLTHEFVSWQQQNGAQDIISMTAPDPEEKHGSTPEKTSNFIKDHASTLAGLSYVAGNLGILYSAMTATPEHCDVNRKRDVDWMKAYSAIAYNLSSGVLLALAPSMDAQRSAEDVAEDAHHRSLKPEKHGSAQLVKQTVDFLRKHPWEVSAALSTSGSLTYLVSVGKKYNETKDSGLLTEAASVVGSIVGMGVTMFMPDKSEEYEQNHPKESLAETAENFNKNRMKDSPSLGERIKGFTDYMTSHPLAMASAFHSGSNIMRTTAALTKHNTDSGLLFSSGAYFAGNILQTQSSKSKAPELEEVVKASANLLRHDPAYAYESDAQLEERINRMAQELDGMHDVKEEHSHIKALLKEKLQERDAPAINFGTDTIPAGSPFMAEARNMSHVERLQGQAQEGQLQV